MSADRDEFEAAYVADAHKKGFPTMTVEEVRGLREGDHYGLIREALNAKWEGWQLAVAAQLPAVEDINAQHWAGMDGAIAFHLIERHSENWSHAARLMHAWLDANQPAARQVPEGMVPMTNERRVPIGNFILGRDGMPQAVSFYPEHFDRLILERGTVTLYAIVKAPGIPATPAGGAE